MLHTLKETYLLTLLGGRMQCFLAVTAVVEIQIPCIDCTINHAINFMLNFFSAQIIWEQSEPLFLNVERRLFKQCNYWRNLAAPQASHLLSCPEYL